MSLSFCFFFFFTKVADNAEGHCRIGSLMGLVSS